MWGCVRQNRLRYLNRFLDPGSEAGMTVIFR